MHWNNSVCVRETQSLLLKVSVTVEFLQDSYHLAKMPQCLKAEEDKEGRGAKPSGIQTQGPSISLRSQPAGLRERAFFSQHFCCVKWAPATWGQSLETPSLSVFSSLSLRQFPLTLSLNLQSFAVSLLLWRKEFDGEQGETFNPFSYQCHVCLFARHSY